MLNIFAKVLNATRVWIIYIFSKFSNRVVVTHGLGSEYMAKQVVSVPWQKPRETRWQNLVSSPLVWVALWLPLRRQKCDGAEVATGVGNRPFLSTSKSQPVTHPQLHVGPTRRPFNALILPIQIARSIQDPLRRAQVWKRDRGKRKTVWARCNTLQNKRALNTHACRTPAEQDRCLHDFGSHWTLLKAHQQEEQHGFQKRRRMEEDLQTATLFLDKAWDKGISLWICIGHTKAFDRANWNASCPPLRHHWCLPSLTLSLVLGTISLGFWKCFVPISRAKCKINMRISQQTDVCNGPKRSGWFFEPVPSAPASEKMFGPSIMERPPLYRKLNSTNTIYFLDIIHQFVKMFARPASSALS